MTLNHDQPVAAPPFPERPPEQDNAAWGRPDADDSPEAFEPFPRAPLPIQEFTTDAAPTIGTSDQRGRRFVSGIPGKLIIGAAGLVAVGSGILVGLNLRGDTTARDAQQVETGDTSVENELDLPTTTTTVSTLPPIPESGEVEAVAREAVLPTATEPQALADQLANNLECALNQNDSLCFALYAHSINDLKWDDVKGWMEIAADERSRNPNYLITIKVTVISASPETKSMEVGVEEVHIGENGKIVMSDVSVQQWVYETEFAVAELPSGRQEATMSRLETATTLYTEEHYEAVP